VKRLVIIGFLALALPLAVLAAEQAGSEQAGSEQAGSEQALRNGAAEIARLHRQADALARTDPKAAADALGQGLKVVLPPGDAARALRGDLHGRLSQLRLQAKDPQGALAAARAGLAEEAGQTPTALTAQLRLREGEALEAVAKKVLDERRTQRREP
jgi:hypothetical protein